MKTKTFKILSIDAWGDSEGGWDWNNWFNAGTFEGNIDDDKSIIPSLIASGHLGSKALELCEIEDDQYNIVIVNKETREPLFAIEYGNTI